MARRACVKSERGNEVSADIGVRRDAFSCALKSVPCIAAPKPVLNAFATRDAFPNAPKGLGTLRQTSSAQVDMVHYLVGYDEPWAPTRTKNVEDRH